MDEVSPALRGYLWATSLAAAALVVRAAADAVAQHPLDPVHRAVWPAIALFAVLAYLAERAVVPVTTLVWRSLDTAVYVAAILLFPWPLPLAIALPGMLLARGWRWRGRLPRDKRAFNVAHGLLTVGLADVLCTRIVAPTTLIRPGHLAAALPGLLLLGALYYVLDVAPLLVVHALTTGRSPWRLWVEQHRPVASFALVDLALGVLAALAWRFDPLALALVALPLAAVAAALRGRARALAAEEHAAAAQALAARDGLTSLLNHQAFQERLEEEVARVARDGPPVALCMVDLDDFGAINNSHGHQVGDAVLVAVAEALRASVRDVDVAARYGGDEFAVILPGATLHEAVAIAERVGAAIAAVMSDAGVRRSALGRAWGSPSCRRTRTRGTGSSGPPTPPRTRRKGRARGVCGRRPPSCVQMPRASAWWQVLGSGGIDVW